MPSLQDFMQELREKDDSDVVYSAKPEDEVRILPPIKNKEQVEVIKKDEKTEQIKVIPPHKEEKKEVKPVSFGNVKVDNKKEEKPIITFRFVGKPKQEAPKQEVPKQEPVKQQEVQKEVVENKPQKQEETRELSEFEKKYLLFKKSGTPENKKEVWFEILNKALASKSRNYTSDTIRSGRFYISANDEILLLPKYDFNNKSVEDVLNDKWLKN